MRHNGQKICGFVCLEYVLTVISLACGGILVLLDYYRREGMSALPADGFRVL